jgi:RNA polymerase sigma-70 factor (ECF subfamily)
MRPSAGDLDFDYESAVAACARGERFALRAIYVRDSRRLLGVATRLVRRRELAEEILQDAFLQIWEKASTFDPSLGSARGWIYSIVRYRALNQIRNDARVDITEATELEYMADQRQTEDKSGLDTDVFSDCMKNLDEQRQRSITLAFVDGYSHEQIAETMNTPLGTIKSWIRRGLTALKECMS